MRKIGIYIALMLNFCLIYGETAEIGFFNVLRLGKSKKDYPALAKTIKNFDITGITEVMNIEGIEKLVIALEKETGEKYSYHITPYPVGRTEYKEYYGYIWKREKVQFLKPLGFYEDKEESFTRPPYGADFKIGNFDFTYVLSHLVYGKKESHRRAEAFKLDEVYDYFQNLDPEEQDIIIGGDFNLPAYDESFEGLTGHGDEIIYAIDPTIKTTIGSKGFANSYDNIFLPLKYTQEFTGNSGAVDHTAGEFERSRKLISDHLPVFIEVNILEDDD